MPKPHKNFQVKLMHVIFCICLFIVCRVSIAKNFYIAAVVEHIPKYSFEFVSKHEAQQIMLANLAVYEVIVVVT